MIIRILTRHASILCITLWIILCHETRVYAFHCDSGFLTRTPFTKTATTGTDTKSHNEDSHRRLQRHVAFAGRKMGMGMGTTAPKKKRGKKNGMQKTKKGSSSSSSSSPPFDVNASLLRLEKQYEEIMSAAAKKLHQDSDNDDDPSYLSTLVSEEDFVTTEYVVATRATATNKKSGSSGASDWVPVAQMCLVRPESDALESEGSSDPNVLAAVSYYCRELSLSASMGSTTFKSVPRNQLQYSVESVDSFYKYVYDPVVEGVGSSDGGNADESMSKSEARQVLEIAEDTNDRSEIKKAYRRLSFEYHPDRMIGTNGDAENNGRGDADDASQKYARVKLAYETLSSGIRGDDGVSWYESLGGRARSDFVGPLSLLSISKAKEMLDRNRIKSAVASIDREVIQNFVTRNLASS